MANRTVTLEKKVSLGPGATFEIAFRPGVPKNMTAAVETADGGILVELFDAAGTRVAFDNTLVRTAFVTHQPKVVGDFRARFSNRSSVAMVIVANVTYVSDDALAKTKIPADKLAKVLRVALTELRPRITLQGKHLRIKGDGSLKALVGKYGDKELDLPFSIDGLDADESAIELGFEPESDGYPFGSIVLGIKCTKPITISKLIGKVRIDRPKIVLRAGISVYNGFHLAPVVLELPDLKPNAIAATVDFFMNIIEEAKGTIAAKVKAFVDGLETSGTLRKLTERFEHVMNMQRLHHMTIDHEGMHLEYEARPVTVPTPVVTTAPKPRSQRLDHLVIVMLENRSFDHMMADIVAGRTDVRCAGDGYSETVIGANGKARIYKRGKSKLHALLEDPSHDSEHQQLQAEGKFVESFLDDHKSSVNGAEVLNYQPRGHVPFFDFLAREFVICDDWRAALRGHTWPNRLYSLSGASKKVQIKQTTGKVITSVSDNPPGSQFEFYTMPTICDVLEAQKVDWAYYKDDFAFIELYRRWVFDQNRVRTRAQFADAIKTGKLPSVVWYEPNISDFGRSLGTDDHPPVSVYNGQRLLADLYAQLCKLPTKKWMLAITYDESGGFYDHLPAETVDDDEPLARKQGFRVPAFLVSPWLDRGKVCSTRFDHTSLIRTVLDNFCMPEPIFQNNRRVRNAAGFAAILEPGSGFSTSAARDMPSFTGVIPMLSGLEMAGPLAEALGEAVQPQKPLFSAFEAAKRELHAPPAPLTPSLELAEAAIATAPEVTFEGLYIQRVELFPELATQGWTAKPWFGDAIEARPPNAISVDAAWDLVHHLRERHPGVVIDPLWETAFDATEPVPELGLEAADVPPMNWHLRAVNAEAAWTVATEAGRSRSGEGIVIGHLDTGYREHPDLLPMLLPQYGWDVEDDDDDPKDDLITGVLKYPGHGTSTISVIGSRGTQDPVKGTAPAVHAIPIRISSSVVHFSMTNMVRGIQIAVERNVHVISLSAGGLWSAALHRAVREATDAGVIVVAAAGNYTRIVVWPARFDEVIACGAINHAGETWRWSNGKRGKHVTVMAPGEAVWCLRPQSESEIKVGPGSGTSFATACVAGAVATWLGHHGRDALIARYGRSNLARVAKAHLRSLTANGDEAGVLDMQKLLAAELPDPTAFGDVTPEHPPIDPLADAAESLGLEGTDQSAYADEVRFRQTVAELSRTPAAAVPALGTLGALEAVESTEPSFPMSARLAGTKKGRN